MDVAVARFDVHHVRRTWPELCRTGVSYPYIQMQSPGRQGALLLGFTINAPAIPHSDTAVCGRT